MKYYNTGPKTGQPLYRFNLWRYDKKDGWWYYAIDCLNPGWTYYRRGPYGPVDEISETDAMILLIGNPYQPMTTIEQCEFYLLRELE